MEIIPFILAVTGLLISPGPTNTMVAMVGVQQGIPGVMRVIPAEVLGYLTTILPLLWLGSLLSNANPLFSDIFKIISAAWVFLIAIKIWRMTPPSIQTPRIGARTIYLTTALNPKCFVFAVSLLPPLISPDVVPRIILMCFCICMIGAAWGAFGSLFKPSLDGSKSFCILKRLASIWLGCVAVTLLTSAVRY